MGRSIKRGSGGNEGQCDIYILRRRLIVIKFDESPQFVFLSYEMALRSRVMCTHTEINGSELCLASATLVQNEISLNQEIQWGEEFCDISYCMLDQHVSTKSTQLHCDLMQQYWLYLFYGKVLRYCVLDADWFSVSKKQWNGNLVKSLQVVKPFHAISLFYSWNRL